MALPFRSSSKCASRPGLGAAIGAALLAGCAPPIAASGGIAAADLAVGAASIDQLAVADPADLASALADLTVPADLTDRYPPGPYGTDAGDTVPDFSFDGYYDVSGQWPASLLPYGKVTFQQLRRSGARYLLIATGAFW